MTSHNYNYKTKRPFFIKNSPKCFTAYNQTTFAILAGITLCSCLKHLNYFGPSQAPSENLFPPRKLGGKSVKMLLAVTKRILMLVMKKVITVG